MAANGTKPVDTQRKLVDTELEGRIIASHRDFGKALFEGVASDKDISKYLSQSKLYNLRGKKWTELAKKAKTEAEIYKPLLNIFKDILQWFKRPVDDSENSVVAKLCAKTRLAHREDVPNTQSSSPDFAIMGFGPSFVEKREDKDGPTYGSSLASWEGKLDSAMGSPHIEQVGVYARQIYNYQPNRNFVRSIVVSEKQVRLLQYDRSGAKHSDPFNFHRQPVRFVKLILGLTSDDPRLVGFDNSISWEVYKGTKDVHGKITTVDAKGDKITYDIVGDRPSFHRRSLIGRATNTWDVTGPNGEEYIVKDSWRTTGRSSEPDLLEAAKGVVGVAQMVAWEDICKVSDFRDLQEGERLTDRTKCRITLERYGRQIEHFQSASQALWALHDAISAHKELFKAGVLHRDISKNNILLGRMDAEPGWRGVLIDMDMSIFVDLAKRDNAADFRTGTRLFQSISVLTSFDEKSPMSQDFYDDVESFFYVLCYLLFKCKRKGLQLDELPKPMLNWDNIEGDVSRTSKYEFVRCDYVRSFTEKHIPEYWGEPCRKLLEGFHAIIQYIVVEKGKIILAKPTAMHIDDLRAQWPKLNAEILHLFKTAIAEVEKAEAEEAANPSAAPQAAEPTPAPGSPHQYSRSPVPPFPTIAPIHKSASAHTSSMRASPSPFIQPPGSSRNNKRASEDPLEDVQPVVKKRRSQRKLLPKASSSKAQDNVADQPLPEEAAVLKLRRSQRTLVTKASMSKVKASSGDEKPVDKPVVKPRRSQRSLNGKSKSNSDDESKKKGKKEPTLPRRRSQRFVGKGEKQT